MFGFTVGFEINDSMRLSLSHGQIFGSESGVLLFEETHLRDADCRVR